MARIHIGGDHAAYELQRELVRWLTEEGHEVVDHGPTTYDELDDYPVFVLRAAAAVAADDGSLGVVLGGSGNGEQMAANKVAGTSSGNQDHTKGQRVAGKHPLHIRIRSIEPRLNGRQGHVDNRHAN